MTAFGVIVAATIKQAQTFTNVMQLMVIPLLFLGRCIRSRACPRGSACSAGGSTMLTVAAAKIRRAE
jgi:hypothetical protein